jgi:hypothetical protein
VLSAPWALAVAAVTTALIGMLSYPGARPGLRHATASGVASGVASALTQTATVALTDHCAPLVSLQVAGVALLVAAFAASGLLLSQTAYRGGLGAPPTVVTPANPTAAAVIGLLLLGERLRGGAAGVLLALAGAGSPPGVWCCSAGRHPATGTPPSRTTSIPWPPCRRCAPTRRLRNRRWCPGSQSRGT